MAGSPSTVREAPPASFRISVLVPCHNYGRFLGEAIASVDAQDRRPDEIIICDDGSSDDTAEVIERIVVGRDDIVVLRHATAHGLIRTFGEMFGRSTGDLILPLSADDRIGADYIATVEQAMLATGWDFGYTNYRCFGSEDFDVDVPEFDADRLVRANYILGSSPFRRTLFERIGGYRPSFESLGFEDYDFWLSAVELGARGGKIHGCVYDWRRHDAGSRNTANRRKRLALRWALFRHHPRFFLHPRTVRCVVDEVRGRLGRR